MIFFSQEESNWKKGSAAVASAVPKGQLSLGLTLHAKRPLKAVPLLLPLSLALEKADERQSQR